MSKFILKFKTLVDHTLAMSDINSFDINLVPKDNYVNAIEQHENLLKINARYNYRKDYVKELYFKKLILRGKLRDEIELFKLILSNSLKKYNH